MCVGGQAHTPHTPTGSRPASGEPSTDEVREQQLRDYVHLLVVIVVGLFLLIVDEARVVGGRGPGGPESPEQGTADGAVSGGVRRCDRAQDACPTLYYMCATAVSVWW